MSISKRGESLQDLIRTIVEASAGGADPATVRDAQHYFASVAGLDYGKALNRQFDRWQIRGLLTEMRSMLPDLNRQVFSETRVRQLAMKAADLGATLKAEPYPGSRGRALRGFYLSRETRKGDPLLYVNTNGHPVEVAAAFWHEIGHHLTYRIFDTGEATLNLTFGADYADHLGSPDELSADMVMTLACYPRRSAQRLFGVKNCSGRDAEKLVMSAKQYVVRTTGMDFDPSTPVQDNVYRLAGMIHLAKLRAALLNEYGI